MRKSFTYDGIRHWVRGKNEAECEAKIVKRIAELEQGILDVKQMQVKAWASEWMDVYKAPKTGLQWYKDIERIVDKFILPSIGTMQLTKVKPMHLQRILNSTTDLSQSYCDKIYQVVTGMFSQAYKNDLIVTDITKGLQKPKGKEAEDRRALTEAERVAFLKACDEHYGGTFLKVIYYCGLRPGEVAGLMRSDIDWENKTVTVSRAVKAGNVLGDVKTRNGRRKVPVPTVLLDELKELPEGEYLLMSPTGKRYTKAMMVHMWDSFLEVMQRQDIENVGDDLTMYCLRHDYCTRLQEAKVPINVAKELMGHANISTTAKIYTHKSEATLKSAQELIEAYASK